MKTSRDQLKAIVKECLLEILSEGLGNVSPQRQLEANQRQISGTSTSRPSQQRRPAFDPTLDRQVTPQRGSLSPALKEAIRAESGGNAIMAAIFSDTARTTLPSMLANGDNGAGAAVSPMQQEQFNGTPEQVFGEDSAGRWANLAFAEPVNKHT